MDSLSTDELQAIVEYAAEEEALPGSEAHENAQRALEILESRSEF